MATNNTALTSVSTTPSEVAACTTVCFSGPTSFAAGPHDNAFTLDRADFNEDGLLDIVFTQAGPAAISVLLGNGTGGFGPPVASHDTWRPAGDRHCRLQQRRPHRHRRVRGAGSTGVAVLRQRPRRIRYGPDSHRGGQSVRSRDRRCQPRRQHRHRAGGHRFAGALVTLLVGNGNGTFQSPAPFGTTTTQSNVIVDDFNNDGNPDVAARALDSITVMLGNGGGGFGAPIPFALPGAMRVRKVGDLNGDGFQDLVVGLSAQCGRERRAVPRGQWRRRIRNAGQPEREWFGRVCHVR